MFLMRGCHRLTEDCRVTARERSSTSDDTTLTKPSLGSLGLTV